MKISNYMNNTNSIMEKNTDKVQKGNSQTNEKHTVGQSVRLSISNEGLEYYRNRIPVSYTHLRGSGTSVKNTNKIGEGCFT